MNRFLDNLRRAAVKKLGGVMWDEAAYKAMHENVIRTDRPIVKVTSKTMLRAPYTGELRSMICQQLAGEMGKFMLDQGCIEFSHETDEFGYTTVTATAHVVKAGDVQR